MKLDKNNVVSKLVQYALAVMTIALTACGGGGSGAGVSAGTATLTPGFTVTPTTLHTAENGAAATYTVALNAKPNGYVVVNVVSADTSEGTVSPATLTFDATTWATPQTVTVTPVDDLIVDGPVTYNIDATINAGSTTDTSGYAALTVPSVSVTNADDDTSDGTPVSPIVLAIGVDLPYNGTVNTTSSYYELTGTGATGITNISLGGLTDNADLYVYSDATFTTLLCSSVLTGSTDSCDVLATGAPLWVKVDGSLTAAGATYTLNAVNMQNIPSANIPVAILDVATVTSTLTAASAPVSLSRVIVQLDLNHTYDSDLVITLISPTLTRVLLSNGQGGSGDNYTNTVFSDAAATPIASGSAPFSGWFVPDAALSALNGQDANGVWTLEIADTVGGDVGTLNSWSINLQ